MFDHSQPKGHDLAELGDMQAIMSHIIDHTTTLTHNGVSLRLFNATHMPAKFGYYDNESGLVRLVGRVYGSGYVAKSTLTEREDRMPDGSIFVNRSYRYTSENVLIAIANAKLYHGVITIASDEYRVAEGYKNTILNPIKIKGYEELWMYYWNKFAVPTYYCKD